MVKQYRAMTTARSFDSKNGIAQRKFQEFAFRARLLEGWHHGAWT